MLKINNSNEIVNNKYYYQQIKIACMDGDIDNIKNILNVFSQYEQTYICNKLLLLSCQNGKLKIVEWLHHSKEINLNIYNDFPFQLACQFGNLDIAKYIYKNSNVRIESNGDYAFMEACRNNFYDIGKWLSTLNPNYKLHSNCYYVDHWSDYPYTLQYALNRLRLDNNNNSEIDKSCIGCDQDAVLLLPCKDYYCIECFIHYFDKIKNNICIYCNYKIKFNEIIVSNKIH